MRTEGRCDRTEPTIACVREHARCEGFAEQRRNALLRGEWQSGWEHGRVSQLCRIRGRAQFIEECPAHLLFAATPARVATARASCRKATARGQSIVRPMRRRATWLAAHRSALRWPRHPRRGTRASAHASTNDRVVGVEAHRDGFAIVDLLDDEVIDERLQLRRDCGRRPESRR